MEMNSFYFSRILGRRAYSRDGELIGKIKDLGIVNELKSPRVEVVKVKTSEGVKLLDWHDVKINKENGQYCLIFNEPEEKKAENIMFLYSHILDKQIIDVNGRKVVRVNDIRLADFSTGLFVVAVDIGTEGILRRIGIAKPLVGLGLKIPSKLILWNNVETIFRQNENIMLSKTYNKLSIFHPSDLADIIEDFDPNTGMMIFKSLDNAKAADVLEEMEDEAKISFIKRISTDKAADILEEMPTDEVADILDSLSDNKAEELLSSMEKETSDEVRELMEYEDDEVGSLMSTEYISFSNSMTIENAINELRKYKPEEDEMYYIYVVNDNNKLVGTLSLRDIIISEPKATLESVMHTEFSYIFDKDNIQELIKIVSKYNLLAIPILDNDMNLLGNVIINDIIYELIKNKRRIV